MSQPRTTPRPPQAQAAPAAPPARDLPARADAATVGLAAVRAQLTAPDAVAQLRGLLPAHVSPERFISTAMLAIQRTPALLNCTGESLFQTCLSAARDGLLLDGREAAAVPFGKEAQYLRMVEGRLKLVRQSGQLRHIDVQVVYPEDEFRYYIDETGPHLRHVPNFASRRREPKRDLVQVYAVATTHDGGTYIEVMTREQVERARAVSRSRNSPMWNDWSDEGWRKTVVNRLFKRLPKATDLPGTEDDEAEAPHPTVEAALGRGLSLDEAVDTAAREARTADHMRRVHGGAAPSAPPAPPPAAAAPAAGPAPEATARQVQAIRTLAGRLGEVVEDAAGRVLGRAVADLDGLTSEEAAAVIKALDADLHDAGREPGDEPPGDEAAGIRGTPTGDELFPNARRGP